MPTQRAITVAPALATFRAELDAWRTGQTKTLASRIEQALVAHITAKTEQILAELTNT